MYYTSFLLLLVCFVFIHPITHTHLHWFKGDDIYQDSNVSIDCSQGNGNDFVMHLVRLPISWWTGQPACWKGDANL
jgi:hypothetical protein